VVPVRAALFRLDD